MFKTVPSFYFLGIFALFYFTSLQTNAQFSSEQALIGAFEKHEKTTKSNDTMRVKELMPFLQIAADNNWQHAWVSIQISRARLFSGLYQYKDLSTVLNETLPIAKSQGLFDETLLLQSILVMSSVYSTDIQADMTAEKILEKNQKIKNKTINYLILHHLSWYYLISENYLNALKTSLKLKEQNGDSNDLINKATLTSQLSEIYYHVGDMEKHLKYSDDAIVLYQQLDDLSGKAIMMYNRIEGFHLDNDFGAIKQYLPEFEQAVIAAGDITIEGDLYRFKGILALYENKYLLAETLLKRSRKIYLENGLDFYAMQSNLELLEALVKQQYYIQAKQKALAIETAVIDYAKTRGLVRFYETTKNIFEYLGDFKEALAASETLKQHQLTLLESKNRTEIVKFEYEQSLKDKESERMMLQAKKSQQNMIWILVFTITALALCFVMFSLWRQTKAKRKLTILANTDVLTGAPNRRSILNEAAIQLDYCESLNQPFTIAIADIDLFKSINDEFGHDVGDKVLKVFSDCSSKALRKTEYFGRFGGEEWLFVLPHTELSFVGTLFERINQIIESHSDLLDLKGRELTFSMGGAQGIKGDTVKSIIDRADKLLYQAKDQGRNRVCF
jgi:diguanylate cyclase (GGDEF)-like protein